MAFRDWLKQYRESQDKDSNTSSNTPSSGSKQPTSGSSGSGNSGTSFRDSLQKYRESQATVTLDGWGKSSISLIKEIQDRSKNWYDDNAYKSWNDRFTKLLSLAENWRKQYEGNSEAISHIDSVVSALSEVKSYTYSARKHYSQWESEDAYNSYVAQQKDYEEKSKFDVKSGEREIKQLENLLEEYKVLSRTMIDEDMEKRLEYIRQNYGDEKGIKTLISQKKQYLNQAKHIQEGITLAGAAGNADFKDYSGYVSTESDGWWDKLTSQYGMGYDDLTYEYINNQNGARDEIKQKYRSFGRDGGGDGESTFEEKGYDYMTEDEVAIYNYYYAKDGKEAAEKYLDSIQESLSLRKATGMYENMEDKTLLELAFGVAAGLDQFESGVKNLFNTEDDYIPQTATQMASGMVREDLADDGFKLPGWMGGASIGQVGYDAITTTANMAPSIMTSMAANILAPGSGAFVGNSMMFASSAGNAYQEALNLGYDKDQARGYSTLVGASEAGLQYLLGGIGQLGGKVSGNAISKVLNGVDNAFARTAIKLGGSMLSEGLEEGLQEVLTPWFKNLTMHSGEKINWSEVAYSTLLGALTAGFMEGTSTISGEVKTYNTGKSLQKADISAVRLAEIGKTFSADTVAYQLAGRVNENTGAYTMGRLFNEIGATMSDQNVTEITEALVAKGMDTATARKNAEALAYVVEGGQLTDRQVAVIEANEVLAEVARTTLIDANTTWNQRSQGYNEMLKSLADEMTAPKAPRTNPAQQSEENAPTADTMDTQGNEAVQSLPEAESVDTSPAKVNSISTIEKGQATIKLEDGSEVNVKDADLSPDDGVRIENIVSIDGISTEDANFILNVLRTNTNASAQMDSLGAKEAYKYGFYGFSMEHIAKHGVFANSLTESQRNAIYETGRNARAKQVEAKQATVSKKERVGDKNTPTGKVHFDGDRTTLTERQSASLTAMEKIADALGVQIYVFESELNERGKRIGANGWYDPKDSSIHIDLHAGSNGEGTMLFTLAHELTHHIRQWSPAKFKTLADFLMQEYGKKGVNVDALVREQMAKAKRNGRTISYDTAYEEVVADSMEMMLSDGNVMKRLEKLKAQDKDLWYQIKKFIDELAAKIRAIYKGMSPDSVEGRHVADMGKAVYRLQELFTEGLVDASENFQSAMEAVVEADADAVNENEIITDGAVVTDGEGKKYSIRSMKHDIAEGQMFEDLKTYCGWTQKQVNELRKNLKDLVEYMTPFRDILDMNESYDREGRRFSPYKPNSDPLYKISMDFSTLCSKRLLTQYVIENHQLRENRPMTAEEQMAIRDMLNEYRKVEKGLQVACAMCYVEAARLKSPQQIGKWLADPETQMRNYFADKDPEFASFIKEKQADFKESRGYARNATKKDMSAKDVRELNKIRPRLRSQYQVSAEEAKIIERAKELPNSTYLTAGNLADLSESDPVIYSAYTAFVRTATRSKSLETDEPYYYGDSRRDNGNGIIVSDSFIEAVNRENGMRFSSWSDWRIQHLLDYITAVIDNSVRGAAMHGYTKFGEEVRVLGKTGMMFNMSGVAGTQTGLNEDGSLSFSPTESMAVNEAIQLRDEFPETAGLQCIGVSDAHIIALLRSDIIDYIIPYHVSGLNAALRRMADIYGWADYTTTQHATIDKSIKFENAVDQEHWHEEPVWSEFFVGYNTGMTGIDAMRASADRYVQMCKDRGLKPKFEQFLKEENYWKLLIDRKMINQKTGKLIQQKAVTPTFDFGTIKEVVDRYVQNYDSGLEARALNHIVENWDSIPKRIKDLKKQGGTKAKKSSKAVDTLANQTLAAQPTKRSDRDLTEDPLYPDTERERSAFNRGYINKTNGLKRNTEKDIIINTHLYTYHVRAVGRSYKSKPYLGEILKKVPIDKAITVEDVREEVINGTYRATEEDYIPYEEAPNVRRRNDRGTSSLRERLTAEGYDYLLDEPYEGDTEGDRGQGSGNRQNSEVKLSDRDTAPTFYSHMARVVNGVKQEKLGAASVVSMLRGKGVKAEEIKWSGIETFLEGKKSVTKEDLQEFIAGSMLQIDEEILTDKDIPYSQEHLDKIAKYEAERDIIAENLKSEWKRIVGTDIPIVYFGAGLESAVVRNLLEANATKKGETEAGYKYKAAKAALQRCIEYSDHYFGFDNVRQAFREAVRDPKDFLKAYEMTSFEEGVFRDFIKAKEAYGKVEGISAQDQKTLKAIAESADRFNKRIADVKSEHYAKAAKQMTKYGNYTIRGGTNYREMLFRMPGSTYYNNPMDIHWDREGVLAHARIQDLNTFLGKMLFIEEIQSDWHNEGHKTGYADVPDAPFRDTYHEYVLKRLIRMAAEQDYDSIGWTTADIQSKRWSDEYAEGYRIEYDQDIPKFLNKYGKKWGTRVGKTTLDNGTEVWSMAITDEMKESVLTEGQPLYQDRDTESVSNRSLLANALEGVAKNDIERNKIQEYKGKIDLINAEEIKLRDLNEKIKDLSFAKGPKDTKAIRDLQFEARQTANRISTYDKMLLRLEASKPLQDVLTREKEMVRKREKQKGKDALEAYREKTMKTQRELLEKWQESRKKGIDSRNRTAMRHKIKDVVNELNQYLLRGTKDRHVPIELQKAVAEALDAVNMDTVGAEERIAKLQDELMKAKTPEKIQEISRKIDHVREMGDKMNGRLQKLKDAYDQFVNSDDPLIANSHDEVISNKLQSVIDSIGNTPLRDMTLSQLEDVYDMYRMVLTTIRNANKAFKAKKSESISILANRVMEEVDTIGGKKKLAMKGMDGIKSFVWNNLKPVYAFEHIGSDTFTEVFNAVRAGEDVWAVDVTEARAFYLDKSKKHGYNSWDFKKRYNFTSTSGMQFSLDLEQIMSLYAYSKRDQAADHLKKGGIVIDETTEITIKNKLGIPVKFNPTEATAYNISEPTLAEIISKLTDEQKAFVDEMQDYLSTVMGAKGNEVSLEMYGIKLFKEKFYFPLKSAHQFMAKAKEQQKGEVKIKNSGFSKETVQKASNPIVLTPFMNVWSDHVNEMSMYHAFVLPMEDFYRVYNYKTPTSETMATESVEMFIQNAYGKGATKYIDQLLKDLNGGARTDSTTGIINKMMGLFKKGAVFASLSVVVQQPSAVARAAALVDTKYFIGPKVDHKRHKLLWDEVKQYAPVAIIKEMGYFDTNMGKSTQDFIMGKEYSGFKEKMKALVTDSGYRDEALSKAPALADEIAWCSIWEAVKRETKAKNPSMDVKSEAFLKKAGERFTEVIVKTQVYDSVLSRNALMRSKDTGMKMATAFMAEPTTSINMIADALLQGKRGNKKYRGAAIGAVVASQIINSILVSFVYAGRDDDEDETYAEKYIGTLSGEILDSLNPAGYIPFIKDIMSIVQGYDVERSDMAVVSDLWNAIQSLTKDNVSVYRKVEGFAGSIAQIFGLPVKNIMRDARGIYQTIMSFVNGQQTTGAGIGYAVKGAITGKDVSDKQQLYEAMLSGDKAQIARVKSRFKDQSAVNSAIRMALRENDPRIREAAIAWNANDLDEYMRLAKAIIAEKHFSQDDVVMAIRAEASALEPDTGTTSTSKAKGLFTAEKFVSAIAQGDEATANAAKIDIIQTSQANGKSAEDAEKSFVSSVKSEMKERFLAGTITKDQVIDTLIDYCGESKEDAEEYVGQWAFAKDYGFSWSDRADAYKSGQISARELQDILVNVGGKTEEEAAWQVKIYDWQNEGFDIDSNQKSVVRDYETFCEPAGIDKQTYFNAYLFYTDAGEEGVSYSKTIECMPYINSLPLTAYQKTQLALCWWAASTVNKYKTW